MTGAAVGSTTVHNYLGSDLVGLRAAVYPTLEFAYNSGTDEQVWNNESTPGYYAFPGFAVAANGDLVVTAMQSTDEQTTRDGRIVRKISTDDGATWGTQGTVADISNDLRDSDLVALSNGDLMCSYTEYLGGSDHQSWTVISTDNGASWGTPVLIVSPLTDWSFICGKPLELPNGDIIAALYGRVISGPRDEIGLSISTDGGASWSADGLMIDTVAFGRAAQEPCLAYDPTLGRVWCAFRSDDFTYGIYMIYSDDGGATWSTPVRQFDGSGKPALHVTAQGPLAVAYRYPSSNRTALRWSWDDAASWTVPLYVSSSALYSYASWATLPDSNLGVAWSVEVSGTRGDVTYSVLSPPEPV